MNEVLPATTHADLDAVRQLFEEYAASLNVDLCVQNIDQEIASLPGDYTPPHGALFLARADGGTAGCIALRHFSETVGELKRLYVRPAFRGRGLARSLVVNAITAARSIGYRVLVLDSLDSMQSAISLYKSFGFERTGPYWSNPFPNVQYFRLVIEPTRDAFLRSKE